MDDDPPPGVEFLDEWDSPRTPRPPRAGRGRILGLSALFLVVAVVVAVALGAAQRRAVGPVTSMSPTPTVAQTATASMTQPSSTYEVTGEVPTAYMSITNDTPPPYTPAPVASDAESDPLTIKLLEKSPKQTDQSVGYKVSVCVNSAATGGGKVHITRESWFLGTPSFGSEGPATDRPQLAPAFPVDGMFGTGECATGYVTFAKPLETPIFISYVDTRFQWGWVFG